MSEPRQPSPIAEGMADAIRTAKLSRGSNAALASLIDKQLPYQLWSFLEDVKKELRSQIEPPEDHHCMSAKRRSLERLLAKLESFL